MLIRDFYLKFGKNYPQFPKLYWKGHVLFVLGRSFNGLVILATTTKETHTTAIQFNL